MIRVFIILLISLSCYASKVEVDPEIKDAVSNMMDVDVYVKEDDLDHKSLGLTDEDAASYREQKVEKPIDDKKSKLIEMEDQGRIEHDKHEYLKDMFIDKHGEEIQKHRKDMQRHVPSNKATGPIKDGLMKELERNGLDCVAEEGSGDIESPYVTSYEEQEDRDGPINSSYEPFSCEYLRNTYDCTDKLEVKCLSKGMKYGEWERRELRMSGPEIYWEHNDWLKSIRVKKRTWETYIEDADPSIRRYIAGKLGVGLERIYENMSLNHERGVGRRHHVEGKSYIRSNFIIYYYYRDGHEICTNWQENWVEKCTLQQ